MDSYKDYLAHHGIKNQKWGKTNGPPYPLSDDQRSSAENKANPTSMSAKRLAKLGPDNRFRNSAKSITTSGAAEGTNLPRNAMSLKRGEVLRLKRKLGETNGSLHPSSDDRRSTAENKANPTSKRATISEASEGTNLPRNETRPAAVIAELERQRRSQTKAEDVSEDRLKKFADKYGYDPTKMGSYKGDDEEEEKKTKEKSSKSSSTKTGKTAEQKAAEKAAKEAEKAAEKERKRIQDAEDRAMRVIDRLFSGGATSRVMDSLLDELSEGWLNGKNFDAEDFKELAKDPKYKEMMEKMETDSKGSDFYAKVIAQLGDSKDPKVKELRKKYEKLIKERHEEDAKQGYEDLEKLKKRMGADYKDQSLDRFSRSISAMTDFVTFMKDANPTEMNRARVRVLSYLEDKISWLNDNGSNAGDRTPTLKEKRNLQKVTEWLRKHGF